MPKVEIQLSKAEVKRKVMQLDEKINHLKKTRQKLINRLLNIRQHQNKFELLKKQYNS